MGDAYKGLTIRIGADTRPLTSAIGSVKKSAGEAQGALRRLEKALKLDPSNTRAMAESIDLLGDKARLSAVEGLKLSRAMAQAKNETVSFSTAAGRFTGTVGQAASAMREVHSESERLRTEIRRTDQQLESIYDAVKRTVAVTQKLKLSDADKQVKKLQRSMAAGGGEAAKARQEIEGLLRLGFEPRKGGSRSPVLKNVLGFDKKHVEDLVSTFNKLHDASSAYHEDQKALDKVQGFKRVRSDAAAAEAELRSLSAQYAKTVAQFGAKDAGPAFASAARSAAVLDRYMEQASENTQRASAAYRQMPHSMDAACAKMQAIRNESELVQEKIKQTELQLQAIQNTPGFDRLAASSADVYANAAKAESRVAEARYELDKAQANADRLASNLHQAEQYGNAADDQVKKISGDFERATASVRMYEEQLEKATAESRRLSMAAEAAGKRSELNSLFASKRQLDSLATSNRLLGKMAGSMRTLGYGLSATITPAVTIAGSMAVSAINDVDAAYRDMRKTVNGTEEQFEQLKSAAVEFSRTHVTSAETILEIEAMGGQLGISADNLEAFARVVSNLDIATNMEADEIAEDLGKMASVMGINVDEYDNFGDALVRLGNNMPVMEGDIMNMTTRYMGMGKVVGMTADQMLGWSSAAIATGQKSEAAGSAMQRFISSVETAVVAGGDKLKAFAKVAGMSGEDFEKAFKTDASGALYSFIEGLGKIQKSGGSVNQTLKDLGFNNVRDKQLLEGLAQQMANGSDTANLLHDSLQMSSDAFHGLSTVMADGTIEESGDAMREAERKSEGFSGELGKLKNNGIAAALELGDGLLPVIKGLNGLVISLGDTLHAMSPEMKTAASVALVAGAAFGPLTVGISSVIAAGSQIIGLFKGFPTAWARLTLGKAAAEKLARAFGIASTQAGAFAGSAGMAGAGAEKASAGFEKMTGKARLAAGAVKVLGTAFSFGGITIALAAIGALVDGYNRAKEKAQDLATASESMNDRVTRALQQVGQTASATEIAPKTPKQVFDDYDSYISKLADSYEELQQKANEAFSNTAIAEHYADVISGLMGKVEQTPGLELTAQEQARLTSAVDAYNDATGESIGITDAANAKLADSQGVAVDSAEAFQKLADAKRWAALQDVYNDEYTTAYKAQADAAKGLADTQKTLREEEEKLNTMREAHIDQTDPYSYLQQEKTIEDLKNQVSEWNDQIGQQQSNMNQATEQMELFALAASKDATALDNLIANSPEVAAAIHSNGENLTQFTDLLDSLGEHATEGLDAVQLQSLAQQWDGSMMSIMPLLNQYQIGLDGLATTKIGGQEFYVTDNGTIYAMSGELAQFDTYQLGNKTYYVDDKGTVMNSKKRLDDLATKKIGNKTYIVSDDGTITGQLAKAQGLKSLQINNKTYYVTDDGTLRDETNEIGKFNDIKLAKKYIETDDKGTTAALTGQAKILVQQYGRVPSKVSTRFTETGGSAVLNLADDIGSRVRDLDNQTAHIYFITHQATVRSSTNSDEGPHAAGAVSTRSIIPRNASGGINGIVTRPTLTNIGWTGEAGAEAIFHMRNAGGAVVPLSNRHYVRPFAQAVAAEMGGGAGGGKVVNNLTVQLTYDSTSEARQMARDIASELDALLKIGA